MAFNQLRRLMAQREADLADSGSSANSCLAEVMAAAQAPEQPQTTTHRFSFDGTLGQQLRTSGFANTSFFVREWQAYEAQYRREHENNAPNLETVQRQFLTPFVDALSNLVFPAGQRDGQSYRDFREHLGRWALCQTVFNNQVMHQFTPQQRQLLQNHDWLHLTALERNRLLLNVPALRQLAREAQVQARLQQLPTFPREDGQRLNRLVTRPGDAPGGQAPPQLSLEERQLRRGVDLYIDALPDSAASRLRREHLRALLNRAPGDRSVADNMELTVCSLMPYIQGANNETYNRMAAFALWSYLRTQPNGLRGALSPELRSRLQIHSDNAATRDSVIGLVDAARAFPNSMHFNADMTTYATAIGLRNMPPHPPR